MQGPVPSHLAGSKAMGCNHNRCEVLKCCLCFCRCLDPVCHMETGGTLGDGGEFPQRGSALINWHYVGTGQDEDSLCRLHVLHCHQSIESCCNDLFGLSQQGYTCKHHKALDLTQKATAGHYATCTRELQRQGTEMQCSVQSSQVQRLQVSVCGLATRFPNHRGLGWRNR